MAKLLIVLLLASPLMIAFRAGELVERSRHQVAVERIEEDDPRWDCRTLGNRVCGPR